MILLTVGTLFPFDRLVRVVDEAMGRGVLTDQVFAQIGPSTYKPKNFEYVTRLEKKEFEDKFEMAEAIVSHAGIGTISAALGHGKPLLVMPRLSRYGEHVNDHQVGTAKKFEELGHVLVAYTEEGFIPKFAQVKTFRPKPRFDEVEKVIARVRLFLDACL